MSANEPRQPKEEYKVLIDDITWIIWDELRHSSNLSRYNVIYARIREKLIAYFEDGEGGKFIKRNVP